MTNLVRDPNAARIAVEDMMRFRDLLDVFAPVDRVHQSAWFNVFPSLTGGGMDLIAAVALDGGLTMACPAERTGPHMSTDHATFRAACAASEEHRGAVDVVAYPDKAFLPVAGAATEPQALTTPFRACPASELLAMGAMARSEFGDAARAALSESRDPWRADVPVSLTGGVVEFTSLSDEPAPEIPDLNAAVETIHMDIPGALLAGFAEVAGPYPVSLEVTRYLLVGFICGPLRLGWTPTRVALNGVLVERGRRG